MTSPRPAARSSEALDQSSGERRCRAAVNLVLTIEAQGDEIVELDAASARALYCDARQRIETEPACRSRRQADRQGAGDRLDRAAARLDAKLVDGSSDATDQRPVSPEQVEPDTVGPRRPRPRPRRERRHPQQGARAGRG